MLLLSPDDAVASGLEVKPHNYLDHTATYIVRGGKILISGCYLTKGRAAEIADGRISSGLAAKLEVDVVKGIQKFTAQLEVDPLRDASSLHET